MAGWGSFYPGGGLEEEEEQQQEEEEGAETVADQRFSGRDSLIFLVDASKAMFESDGDADTPFDMTIQCIRNVYTSKIISSDRDLLSVVFYGTENNKNSADFKHIYVLQELDNPGAKRVLELDQYKGDEGRALFQETFGHNADYSLGEALWACSNLFSGVRVKLSHKRIMLFTNEDDPHANDTAKAKLARTRAGDLRDTGIILDLMHLKKPGGFDISLFYRDIINVAEDEDLGIQTKESEKLEHLMKKVRAKETKKRTLVRLNLHLSNDVVLSVGVYNLIQKAHKPYPVKLYRETNEPVKTKTRMFSGKTGSLLLPSDTKRAQTYGKRQIVLEKEETEELKRFDSPGLFLIGFKPLSMLKQHHHIRPSQFIYPEESLVRGSTVLFNALLMKCLEREMMMLCRYIPRWNVPPRFVALVPQEEGLDEQKVQIAPPGFHMIFLPYADDKRNVDSTENVPASQEQVDKMKEIIQKLRFKYRPDSFENPVLQQHFRNLEALALDLREPEQAEDLTSELIVHLVTQMTHCGPFPPDPLCQDTFKLSRSLGGSTAPSRIILFIRSIDQTEILMKILKREISEKELCFEDCIFPIVPKSEQMSDRLGNLVDEFKQLVYPPDYNPDGKAVMRKQASGGQTEKRPKVEVSKDELRSHVQKGTLGKLTVPALKDACRFLGLRCGSKKQELVDALTEHFIEC